MFRPVHFEIHAENPERAAKFYTDVFGWTITKWDSPDMEYWMVMTAPADDKTLGIHGGLVRRKGPAPAADAPVSAFVCTMDVPNIDEALEKALKAGATLALPKFDIGGMAWQAYVKDTEGNIIGLHEAVKK